MLVRSFKIKKKKRISIFAFVRLAFFFFYFGYFFFDIFIHYTIIESREQERFIGKMRAYNMGTVPKKVAALKNLNLLLATRKQNLAL